MRQAASRDDGDDHSPSRRSGGGKSPAGKTTDGKSSSGKDGAPKSHRRSSKHAAKPPTQRQLRVAEEIRHVLASLFLRGEIRDPDLMGVTITVTEVRISPDLRKATAFVTRLGRSDVAAKLPALKRVAPYLRGQVAKALLLRVAPEISFQPDTSIDYAMHVDELMRAPDVARDLGANAPAVPDLEKP